MNTFEQRPGTLDLLGSIVESLPLRVFWKDRDSRYLGCNTLFAVDAGFSTPAEVVGRTDADLRWHAHADRYQASDRRVLASAASELGYEEPQTAAGGGEMWVRVSKVPLRDAEGTVIGILGTYEDVTDQRIARERLQLTTFTTEHARDGTEAFRAHWAALAETAEARLRGSEDRLRTLAEQSPLATQIIGTDGRTRLVNRAWEQLWGVPFAALADYNVFEDPQLEALGRIDFVRRAFAGETVRLDPIEYDRLGTPAVKSAAAGTLWVRTLLYPLRSAEGTVREVVLVHEDLTEVRAADRARAESERRFRDLFERSPDACWIVDEANVFTLANQAAAAMLGYDAAGQIEALHPSEVSPEFQPDGRLSREKADEMIDLAHTQGIHRFEWMHRRRDGSDVPAEITLAHVEIDGRPHLYCTGRDISARWEQEASLAETRRRHEEAQRIAHLGHWRVDLLSRVSEWSDETYRVLGLDPATTTPTPDAYRGRIHPDDQASARAAYQDSLRTGEPFDIEHRLIRPDGTIRWINARCETTYDAEGRPRVSVGTALDITARRMADQRLQDSNDFLGKIVANAAEGVAVCQPTETFPFLRFSVWNDRMTEIVGYTLDEINRLGWYQSLYPDLELQARAVERTAQTRTGSNLVAEEWVVTTKAGEKRALAISTSTMTLADGAPAVVALMQDVTDRRRASEALHKSEQKYRGIFDDSVAAIYFFDAEKRFIDTNRAGEELLGYSREELLRLSIPDVDADPVAVQPAHAELLAGGELKNFEHRLKHKSGRVVTVLNNSRPIVDGDGRIVGLQSTLIDVTEQRRAQEEQDRLRAQLAASQKLDSIGRLAGGVAHDFNNLLGVILGRTSMAAESLDPSHPVQTDLKEVLDAAERSAELTRQLLAFARRQTATPVEIDLNEKVGGVLKILRRLIGEHITLIWSPAAQLTTVRMDPSQVDQILANLCVNARDAISGVGHIRIETGFASPADAARFTGGAQGQPVGRFVVLSVMDSGCGMERTVVENIFEPFYTTKSVGQGTGLGLATVYGIVKQNGGHVEVQSSPGKGTTFHVYLPAVEGRPDYHRGGPAAPPVPPGTERLLLVEDEPAVMRLTKRMLERLGYHVLAAGGPEEALRVVAEDPTPIDMLMTDVIMPEMSGWDLSRELLKQNPDLRVLFMSGYTADVIADHGVLGSDVHFIQKPFVFNDLGAKIRAVLERRST